MSKSLVVCRMVSAVEKCFDEAGNIIDERKRGVARMKAQTAARKGIFKFNESQVTYLDAMNTDMWVDQLVAPNEVKAIVDAIYGAFDAYCDVARA